MPDPRHWGRACLALLVVALSACTAGVPTADRAASATAAAAASAAVASESAIQPSDLVDLTVYFRHGKGRRARLSPVVREVPVSDDLPRTALELLIAGPRREDGPGLAAPLPPTTEVKSLRLEGDTAFVDLSREVVTDARRVGDSPANEALALAALVDTLTEFRTISKVRAAVEGRSGGRFWGGWGLPRLLTRDDSVIGPSEDGEAIPDLAAFRRRRQRIGTREPASPARVAGVRAHPRAGYLRVVVELIPAGGDEVQGTVPMTRARSVGRRVILSLADPAGVGPRATTTIGLEHPAFRQMTVRRGGRPGTVNVVVATSSPRRFWLHTLSDPTRVVLDVKS